MKCFLTVISPKRGYVYNQLPCEDIESALRKAKPYLLGTAKRVLHYGVFDFKGDELQAVYFDRIGTGLRADVSSITIKTASGFLEASHSKVPKA